MSWNVKAPWPGVCSFLAYSLRSSCLVVYSYFIYFVFCFCFHGDDVVLFFVKSGTRLSCRLISPFPSVSSHRVLFWEFFFSIPAGQTHSFFRFPLCCSFVDKIENWNNGERNSVMRTNGWDSPQQMKLKNKKEQNKNEDIPSVASSCTLFSCEQSRYRISVRRRRRIIITLMA